MHTMVGSGPANTFHYFCAEDLVDQSASAVVNRIRAQLPDKAARLLKGRVRVVK